MLYNTVDSVVVGNFVGMNALGAVGGATASVINLILGFFVGVSSGATVVIALEDFLRYLAAVGNSYEFIELYELKPNTP